MTHSKAHIEGKIGLHDVEAETETVFGDGETVFSETWPQKNLIPLPEPVLRQLSEAEISTLIRRFEVRKFSFTMG